MTNEMILANMKNQLDAAPKSKAGFVNWKRSSRLQREAVALMSGDERANKTAAYNIAVPYDTYLSRN